VSDSDSKFKETSLFIENLKKSNLSAQCPHCQKSFEFSQATLFDGRKKFPGNAEEKKQEMQTELDEILAELKNKQIKADTGAEKKAIEVGIGKIIEKVLPAYKNFNMNLADCRFLAEPIDMIVFDGSTNMNINHISFMEIKTGNSKLNTHQRMVRDAVLENNVKYEMI